MAGASTWAIVGRLFGLAWTVLLVAKLGISDYGLYAMAFSLSGVFAGVLDGPATFRAARVSEVEFESDQAWRGTVGPVVMVAGLAIAATCSYVIGFALVFVAGEHLLGVYKAHARRHGNPLREQVIDLARQITSISLGSVCLLAFTDSLDSVTFAYSAPYVVGGIAATIAVAKSPRRRVDRREWAAHSMTGLVGAGYVQLDVVVLGALLGSAAAGVYGLASLVAWAMTVPLQQYATRAVPSLRSGELEPASFIGAPRLGLGLAAITLVSGAIAEMTNIGPAEFGTCLVLMAPFVATRAVNWALTLGMIVAHADRQRFNISASTLLFNMLLLLGLSALLGVTAAPIASSAADLVLLVMFARVLHAKVGRAHVVAYILLVAASVAVALVV